MNAREQEDILRRLDATKVVVFRKSVAGGNVRSVDPVAWAVVLHTLLARHGWGVMLARDHEPDPRQLSLVPGDAA